jgi:hypothetical protein
LLDARVGCAGLGALVLAAADEVAADAAVRHAGALVDGARNVCVARESGAIA